jgi:hypothetical protein
VNDLLLNATRFGMLVFLLTSMVEQGSSLILGQVLAPLKHVRPIALLETMDRRLQQVMPIPAGLYGSSLALLHAAALDGRPLSNHAQRLH